LKKNCSTGSKPATKNKLRPYYAAARLWVDNIIDPIDTRLVIAEGIAAANQNPDMENFRTGVFQV
jgi:3-methylcrotonyl-CoA carboxylase beta subunit